MTVDDVFATLREAGIELTAEGDRIKYRPRDRMTPALAAVLQAHRAEVLSRITRNNDPPIACNACGAGLKPTVAAYGLGRCTLHMSDDEFSGWLRFHRSHWREYYDSKTGVRL